MYERLLQQAATWSSTEIIGVVAAILYLFFAIRQNIICWLFAAISTAIYIWVFAGAKLYMEAALNGLYFLLAIYGWYTWSSGVTGAGLAVTRWPMARHAIALAVVAVLVATSGALLSRYTDAAFPYFDSATTWLSVWATLLVAFKVLENWWYWLAIDAVSIVLYWDRGLELTALLFVVYIGMIPFGFVSWRNSMRVLVSA